MDVHGPITAGQRFVERAAGCDTALLADAAGQISLRVGIDSQHSTTCHCQRGREVDGRRGFADATFLVGNGNDA